MQRPEPGERCRCVQPYVSSRWTPSDEVIVELGIAIATEKFLSLRGYAETSQEHSLSSSNRLSYREGQVFGIGLAGLEAVVEAAEEAVEQVAFCGSVPIAGHAASVVVGPGTG